MNKRIMMVDKDQAFIESTREALEHKGFSVESVSGGDKCIESVKNIKPDVILFDVQVEDGDNGIKSCRRVARHENSKDIPMIIVSSIRKDMNLPFGFESDPEFLPVKAIVDKPINPEEIVELINKVLGK